MRVIIRTALGAAAFVCCLALAGPAAANNFCVPTYSADCPASGTNEAEPDLNAALSAYGSDGNPDRVIIAPGTQTSTGSFKAPGNDPLEIIGSGRDKTFLTSSATGNTYVLDLTSGSNRAVTVKNLAVVVPTSFSTGAAVSESADRFESVDLISRNNGSSGVYNPTGGSSFSDVRAFGQNGAGFGGVFYQQSQCGTGPITFERIHITDASSGLIWNCPEANPVTVDRARFTGVGAAISVSDGALVSVTNTLVESGEGAPIRAFSAANKVTTLNLDHLTMVATGDPNQPAIRAQVNGVASPTKDIEISIGNSIISGFANSWSLEAPVDSVKGNVSLDASFLASDSDGLTAGESFVTGANNLALGGEAIFAAADDFRLATGSVVIDAGDPAATLPDHDLDGEPRPVDGNADLVPVGDLGAYEYQPTCEEDPTFCPVDATAPRISKVSFASSPGRGSSLRLKISEAATVKAVFTPLSKRGRPKRGKVKLSRKARAGSLTIKLGKRKLKPGRYRLTLQAADKAGNKSKMITRKVRVKG